MSKPFNNFVIIDDDSCHNIICALSLKNAFKPININIVGFTNAIDGINYLKENAPKHEAKTVLFLDINMPGVSGWQVLAKLEKLPSKIRSKIVVYMLTSSTSVADHVKALSFSCVKDCLTKPLSDHLLQISEELRETSLLKKMCVA